MTPPNERESLVQPTHTPNGQSPAEIGFFHLLLQPKEYTIEAMARRLGEDLKKIQERRMLLQREIIDVLQKRWTF